MPPNPSPAAGAPETPERELPAPDSLDTRLEELEEKTGELTEAAEERGEETVSTVEETRDELEKAKQSLPGTTPEKPDSANTPEAKSLMPPKVQKVEQEQWYKPATWTKETREKAEKITQIAVIGTGVVGGLLLMKWLLGKTAKAAEGAVKTYGKVQRGMMWLVGGAIVAAGAALGIVAWKNYGEIKKKMATLENAYEDMKGKTGEALEKARDRYKKAEEEVDELKKGLPKPLADRIQSPAEAIEKTEAFAAAEMTERMLPMQFDIAEQIGDKPPSSYVDGAKNIMSLAFRNEKPFGLFLDCMDGKNSDAQLDASLRLLKNDYDALPELQKAEMRESMRFLVAFLEKNRKTIEKNAMIMGKKPEELQLSEALNFFVQMPGALSALSGHMRTTINEVRKGNLSALDISNIDFSAIFNKKTYASAAYKTLILPLSDKQLETMTDEERKQVLSSTEKVLEFFTFDSASGLTLANIRENDAIPMEWKTTSGEIKPEFAEAYAMVLKLCDNVQAEATVEALMKATFLRPQKDMDADEIEQMKAIETFYRSLILDGKLKLPEALQLYVLLSAESPSRPLITFKAIDLLRNAGDEEIRDMAVDRYLDVGNTLAAAALSNASLEKLMIEWDLSPEQQREMRNFALYIGHEAYDKLGDLWDSYKKLWEHNPGVAALVSTPYIAGAITTSGSAVYMGLKARSFIDGIRWGEVSRLTTMTPDEVMKLCKLSSIDEATEAIRFLKELNTDHTNLSKGFDWRGERFKVTKQAREYVKTLKKGKTPAATPGTGTATEAAEAAVTTTDDAIKVAAEAAEQVTKIPEQIANAERLALKARDLQKAATAMAEGPAKAAAMAEARLALAEANTAIETTHKAIQASKAAKGGAVATEQLSRFGKAIRVMKGVAKVAAVAGALAEIYFTYDYIYNVRPELEKKIEEETDKSKKAMMAHKMRAMDVSTGINVVGAGLSFSPAWPAGLIIIGANEGFKHTYGAVYEAHDYILQDSNDFQKLPPGLMLEAVGKTTALTGVNWTSDQLFWLAGGLEDIQDANAGIRSRAYMTYFRQVGMEVLPVLTKDDLPSYQQELEGEELNAELKKRNEEIWEMFSIYSVSYVSESTGGKYTLTTDETLRRAEAYGKLMTSTMRENIKNEILDADGTAYVEDRKQVDFNALPVNSNGTHSDDLHEINKKIQKQTNDEWNVAVTRLELFQGEPELFETRFTYEMLNRVRHEMGLVDQALRALGEEDKALARYGYATAIRDVLDRGMADARKGTRLEKADFDQMISSIQAILRENSQVVAERIKQSGSSFTITRIGRNPALLSVLGMSHYMQLNPTEAKDMPIGEKRRRKGEELMQKTNAGDRAAYFVKQYGTWVNKYLYVQFDDASGKWQAGLGGVDNMQDPSSFRANMVGGSAKYNELLDELAAINALSE